MIYTLHYHQQRDLICFIIEKTFILYFHYKNACFYEPSFFNMEMTINDLDHPEILRLSILRFRRVSKITFLRRHVAAALFPIPITSLLFSFATSFKMGAASASCGGLGRIRPGPLSFPCCS